MVVSRYAGVGEFCPLFNVEVTGGGSLSTNGTLYFSFQLQNRAGFNIPSVSDAIAYSPGQKIVITIPESVRADGWDIHYFVVSAGTTSDPSTHVQIAGRSGFEYGPGYEPQSAKILLPATIELTHDEHILLAPSVADLASLPIGVDRIDKQIRWVTSESKWFQYRADSELPANNDVISADVGRWVRVGTANIYVSDTRTGMGSDRPLNSINPVTVISTPIYPGQTLDKYLPQWEAKYWKVNNTDNVLPAGTEFGIELEYNNRRSPDLLSGLFMVKFIGFVGTDGTIRTQDAEGRDFPNLGAFFPWTPKLTTPFVTIDPLQPGEAIALAVKPFFSVAELNNQISPKDIIGVIPVIRTQSGDYNPLGKLLPGGTVYPSADKYRVVPNVGLIFDILEGHAIVAGYDFPVKPRRTYGGLQANLPAQKIIINGNAAVFAQPSTYTPSSSEAIRSVVSTVAGESNPGEWSEYLPTSALVLTLSYPSAIRADYPDVIAGNDKAVFNPTLINIYIQREDTLEIRKFSGFGAIASAGQEFTITNWDAGVIAFLPVAAADFSLFAPGETAIAPTAGNFPATNFRASYSFEYDGFQITSISHVSPPCIKEWVGDFQPPSVFVEPGVITLPSGSPATIENTGTNTDLNLVFSLPSGDPGADGEVGSPGINAFTQTTADFIIPSVGGSVTISVENSEWMSIGQLIYVGQAGSFTVSAKPDATSVTAQNNGYQGNLDPDANVTTGKGVSPSGAVGLSGTSGHTTTTAAYAQPAIGETVEVAVVDSNWMATGLTVYIATGGYYLVQSRPSSDSVILQNTGVADNAIEGEIVAQSRIVSSAGVTGSQGADGNPGQDGRNAFSVTTELFTQPGANSNVTVAVQNSTWISLGQTVYVRDGGTYEVSGIPTTTSVTLKNLGYPGNAASGATISNGRNISPSGLKGEAGEGTPGKNAFTNTIQTFSQPDSGSTVTISVGSTEWMAIGQAIYIYTGGYYQVINIFDITSVQIQNLGYPQNATPGSSINSSQEVVPSGFIGMAGAVGSVESASSLSLLSQVSDPSTPEDIIALYNKEDALYFRESLNGAVHKIPQSKNRETIIFTTPSLNPGESAFTSIQIAKGFTCLQLSTDKPARAMFYSNATYQNLDSGRDIETDPTGDHGLLLEVVTESGFLSKNLSPVVDIFTIPETIEVPVTITNMSNLSGDVTINLLIIKNEE